MDDRPVATFTRAQASNKHAAASIDDLSPQPDRGLVAGRRSLGRLRGVIGGNG